MLGLGAAAVLGGIALPTWSVCGHSLFLQVLFHSFVVSLLVLSIQVIVLLQKRLWSYRVALDFQESRFSRMVVFEDFVEIISQIRCLNHLHTAHVMYMCVAYKEFYLIRTVTPSALKLAAVNTEMPSSKVSLWRASLVDFGSMLSMDVLARVTCK